MAEVRTSFEKLSALYANIKNAPRHRELADKVVQELFVRALEDDVDPSLRYLDRPEFQAEDSKESTVESEQVDDPAMADSDDADSSAGDDGVVGV